MGTAGPVCPLLPQPVTGASPPAWMCGLAAKSSYLDRVFGLVREKQRNEYELGCTKRAKKKYAAFHTISSLPPPSCHSQTPCVVRWSVLGWNSENKCTF